MKLLEELNQIITEADKTSMDVNGFNVSIYETEASHGYLPGKLLFHASHHGPEEWSDSESTHLTVDAVKLKVTNTRGQTYFVEYNLKGEDFHEDNKKLVAAMKSTVPEIFDPEEEPVTDQQTVAILRSVCSQYAEKFHLLDYLYEHASQDEQEYPEDDHYDDGDDYEEVHQYYDGH